MFALDAGCWCRCKVLLLDVPGCVCFGTWVLVHSKLIAYMTVLCGHSQTNKTQHLCGKRALCCHVTVEKLASSAVLAPSDCP